ncbi:hypothetical protein SH449x_005084 [Pirellulaceae bacterium SH449]
MKKSTTKDATAGCCDGKFVKVSGEKLIFTCEEGEEHQYSVDKETKVMRDGKPTKLVNIKKGETIRMTMCNDEKSKVNLVDCGEHIPDLALT